MAMNVNLASHLPEYKSRFFNSPLCNPDTTIILNLQREAYIAHRPETIAWCSKIKALTYLFQCAPYAPHPPYWPLGPTRAALPCPGHLFILELLLSWFPAPKNAWAPRPICLGSSFIVDDQLMSHYLIAIALTEFFRIRALGMYSILKGLRVSTGLRGPVASWVHQTEEFEALRNVAGENILFACFSWGLMEP